MDFEKMILIVSLIVCLMYVTLELYFTYREDKQEKEWQKNQRLQNLKRN